MGTLIYIMLFSVFCHISKNDRLTISGVTKAGIIGEEFTFKCTFPKSKRRIRWFRNNIPIAIVDTDSCKPQNDANAKYTYKCDTEKNTVYLKIPGENMTDNEDSTTWKCRDEYKGFSNDVCLSVTVPVKTASLFLISNDGNNLTLECVTSPCRPSAKITWYKKRNNTTETVTGGTQETTETNEARNVTHSIIISSYNDDMIFCSANNSDFHSEVSSNSFATPFINKDIPKYINGSRNNVLYVNKSDSIILHCTEVQPKSSDRVFIEKNRNAYETEKRILNFSKTLLQNAVCYDTGIYQCNNQKEGNTSSPTKLIVSCKPTVLNKSASYILHQIGDSLQLFVSFLVYPSSILNWTFCQNGIKENLTPVKNIRFSTRVVTLDEFSNKTELTSLNMSKDDFGEYKLRLENDIGVVEVKFTVIQNGTTDYELPLGLVPAAFVTSFMIVFVFLWRKYRKVKHKEGKVKENNLALPQGYDGSYRDNDMYIPCEPELEMSVKKLDGRNTRSDSKTNSVKVADISPCPGSKHVGNKVSVDTASTPLHQIKKARAVSNQYTQGQEGQHSGSNSAVADVYHETIEMESEEYVPPIPPRKYKDSTTD